MTAPIAAPGRIRGVIFDLDDTLYPEMRFVEDGLQAAAAAAALRFGVDQGELFEAMLAALDRDLTEYGQARTVFNAALAACGIAEEADTIRWLVSIYRLHPGALEPYPDVAPVLERLAGAVKLGLITDGPLEMQRHKWENFPLAGLFSVAVFTDEHGPDRCKPSQFAFTRIETELALDGDALVYVGDNPGKDFLGARERGWLTVRIRREGSRHCRSEAAPGKDADAEIDSLARLPELLGLAV